MGNVRVIEHPLVKHHLAELRDVSTIPTAFRAIIHRLSSLLAYEATQDLPLKDTTVSTPLTEARAAELDCRVGVIPILRAGLGMADPVLHMIPTAELWHLGFYRDETTLQPVVYYKKLPKAEPVDIGIIVDPMLATGGSALAAIDALKEWGVPRIKVAAIIAAPEGIEAVTKKHPNVQLYLCARDERLNEQGYIVPGLGDAGDRMCNTVRE
jgi:uracil phosphoribosyltransferase